MLSEALSGVWTIADPDQEPIRSPGCSHHRVHWGWAWLDPWWPIASQTSTATTHPPSTPWVIKASLGTASPCITGWPTNTYCTQTRMDQVCAYFVTRYSDTLTQPSMHTCVIILIDSVCATRPLFCLGDAITVLNAYTKGSAHVCECLCAYVHRRPLTNTPCIEPTVYATRKIMIVHVCEQVNIRCVLMRYMLTHHTVRTSLLYSTSIDYISQFTSEGTWERHKWLFWHVNYSDQVFASSFLTTSQSQVVFHQSF